MYIRKSVWMTIVAAGLATSCASEKNTVDKGVATYGDVQQGGDLAAERIEFMTEQRKKLDRLSADISRLETKIQSEAALVDPAQQDQWNRELSSLKQEYQQTSVELERAQRSTPEQWAESRGLLSPSVTSMEAGTGGEMFAAEEPAWADVTRAQSSGVDLCKIQVADTDAYVVEREGQLIVQMTTDDEDDLTTLRERAQAMSREVASGAGPTGSVEDRPDERDTAAPQGEEPIPRGPETARTDDRDSGSWDTQPPEKTAGTARPDERDPATSSARHTALIEEVTVQNVEDGVRVIFYPAEGQQAALRAQLESEVARIENEQC